MDRAYSCGLKTHSSTRIFQGLGSHLPGSGQWPNLPRTRSSFNAPLGHWDTLGESVFNLNLSPTGFLSPALMGVTKIPVEENLCTTVPCRLAFPKGPLSSAMIMGYWLNKNISAPVATNKSNVIIDDHSNGRFHILWNLEERDCTLLTRNVLKRFNATYLSPADLYEQKAAFLRENITLFLSGDVQSHAMGGVERRSSRRGSSNCAASTSPGTGLKKKKN